MQRSFTKLTLVFTLMFLGTLAHAETYPSSATSSGSQPAQVAVTLSVQAPSITVVSTSDTQIKLSWRDAFKGETAYQIERRDLEGNTEFINLPKNSASFIDDEVDSGESYEYRLRAWKLIIRTKPSNFVKASAIVNPVSPAPTPIPLPYGSGYTTPQPIPTTTSSTSVYYSSPTYR